MPSAMRTVVLLSIFIAASQVSDYTGTTALLYSVKALWLLGGSGYGATWF